ncbi:MAG: spinster family MFS transporter [Gammaproteobacteria bacterium]
MTDTSAARHGSTTADVNDRASPASWYTVGLLALMYAIHTYDRSVVTAVLEPIKDEFGLSDTQLGALSGMAFGVAFGIAGIPMGMLVDRLNRARLLAGLLMTWSGLTALTGFANSFMSLVLMRMGVAAAESGGQPLAMSLITDTFAPRLRALASGLFFASTPAGTLIGFVVTGYVAAHHGWRTAFFVAGVPGILLAVLIWFTLREPRESRPAAGPAPAPAQEHATYPLRAVAAYILGQRSLLCIMSGIIMVSLTSTAFSIWLPSFLIRSHGQDVATAAFLTAIVAGGMGVVSAPLGGLVTHLLSRSDIRRQPWSAAAVAAFSVPFMLATFLAESLPVVVACACVWTFVTFMIHAPVYSLCASLVPPRMRGTTMAILAVLNNVVGYGLGPQIVGILSDLYRPVAGIEALRYAILSVAVLKLVSAVLFFASARHLEAELQRAATPA